MTDRMTVTGGSVYLEDGALTGIEFVNCEITLGPRVSLSDCSIDFISTVRLGTA